MSTHYNSIQLGEDGRGPGQAVAGGRRGMGLKPPADGKDCPFQLGRDALGDVVMSSRQVVQALGAGLQVAAPPLAEPGLAEAQSGADVLDSARKQTALCNRKRVEINVDPLQQYPGSLKPKLAVPPTPSRSLNKRDIRTQTSFRTLSKSAS